MSATRMSATTKNLKTSNFDNLYSRQPLKNTSGASSIKKLNFKVSSIFTQKQIPNNLEQPILTPAPFATIDHLPGTDRQGSTSKIHNSRNNSNQKVHSPRQIQFQLKSAYTPRANQRHLSSHSIGVDQRSGRGEEVKQRGLSASKTNDSPVNEGVKLGQLGWQKYESGQRLDKKSPQKNQKTNLNFIAKFANDKMF